jgi:molybdopterin-guanine dinucleotide biosynthesis protein A
MVADAQEECGPLGGIVGALRCSSSDLLLALAVDLPNMSADYLRGLLDRCAGDKGVIPWRDRYEPLAAVYPKRSLDRAEQLLEAGEYSLQSFADSCVREALATKHAISSGDAALFLNMNTPADLLEVVR